MHLYRYIRRCFSEARSEIDPSVLSNSFKICDRLALGPNALTLVDRVLSK